MTTESTKRYRETQFNLVGTEYSVFKPKIKIIKPDRETNWMDITETELQNIKVLLTG